MTDYCTLADTKLRLGLTDTDDDALITSAITAASRAVDRYCRRRFNLDAQVSTRRYAPTHSYSLLVDDIGTLTGLVVATDDNDDGTAETTWTVTTEFEAGPVNALADGRPLTRLTAVGSRRWPHSNRPAVHVTARFGWPSVPEDVREATLIKAVHLFRRKDTPDGVAGSGEFGVVRISRYEDPDVVMLLASFRTMRGMVA